MQTFGDLGKLLLHALRVRETSVDIVVLGGFVLSRSCAIGTRKGKKSRVLEGVVLPTQLFDALKGIANRTCAASCARRRATRLKELFVKALLLAMGDFINVDHRIPQRLHLISFFSDRSRQGSIGRKCEICGIRIDPC
jgi:PleD family two-component response regulator